MPVAFGVCRNSGGHRKTLSECIGMLPRKKNNFGKWSSICKMLWKKVCFGSYFAKKLIFEMEIHLNNLLRKSSKLR